PGSDERSGARNPPRAGPSRGSALGDLENRGSSVTSSQRSPFKSYAIQLFGALSVPLLLTGRVASSCRVVIDPSVIEDPNSLHYLCPATPAVTSCMTDPRS